jgi:integrase
MNGNTTDDFLSFCIATGMRQDTAEKYCSRIRLFKLHFGLPEKGNLNLVFSQFENNGFSEATKNVYKITLRKYLTYKFGRIPKAIKPYLHIREYYIIRPLKVTLEEKEMLAILKLCRNPAEKCLLGTLMETGCRIDELLSAKVEDVSFDKLGAIIIRDRGKNGKPRRIRIIKTAKLLKRYLKGKPPKDKLFDYTYDQVRNIFRCRINRKLNKHLSPKMFRKMAATRLANHMTEYQLCQTMGWVPGSRMARHYVFLSGRDTDPVLARVNRGSWN